MRRGTSLTKQQRTMKRSTAAWAGLAQLPPREIAEMLVRLQPGDVSRGRPSAPGWLDEILEHLDALRTGESLRRTLSVWGLKQSAATGLLGLSRQALHKWLANGVPMKRAESVADLAAATDLLVRHLKRERIPAVVRRPMPELGNKSLLDLLIEGRTKAVLDACRNMFDFQAAQR